MKTNPLMILSVASCLCALHSAPAAGETTPVIPDDRRATEAAFQIRSAPATELIGREVMDVDGSGFATLEDFIIDLENGRVVQAVVSGSDAGAGRVEVPARGFDYTRTTRVLRWRGERAKLGSSPRFSPPGSNQPGQSVHAAEVYRYYGEEPYFSVETRTERVAPNNVHTHGKISPGALVTLGPVALASDLIGLDVSDTEGRKVGAIQDLIIDLPAGRVVAVVIASRGFIGIGGARHAVPPGALDYAEDGSERLRLAASRETLRNSPRYQAEKAILFDEPGYTDEVYRSFDQEPYSKIVAADNTRSNRRDRSGDTLTPLDQSNAAGDVEAAARVRKAIVARDDFSVNAHNVKIITRDGTVTLRGPVKTSGEKTDIGAIAKREAGAAYRVDNQLEVAGE